MSDSPTTLAFDSIKDAISYFGSLPKEPPAPRKPKPLFDPRSLRDLTSFVTAAYSPRSYMYLYVMTCGKHCKIGISAEPHGRMMGLQGANAVKIELAAKWNFYGRSAALHAEAILHSKFAEKRTHGEWFTIKQDVALRYAQELHRMVTIDCPAKVGNPC